MNAENFYYHNNYDIDKHQEVFEFAEKYAASDSNFLTRVLDELKLAKEKHPIFPTDVLHQIAIVNEESGEATRATLQFVYEKGSKKEIENELIQTAAMCLRMLANL